MKMTIGNYTLTEKYHAPCIYYTEKNEDGENEIIEFTYPTVEDALADILYFVWEDRLFHNTQEFKQSTANCAPNKYREILENRYPNIGFAKLNAKVITGQK